MRVFDSIKYAFIKVIRNKKNIYFISILCICIVVLLGTLTFRNSYFNLLEKEYDNNILYRNLLVGPNPNEYAKYGINYDYDIDKIRDINHIVDIYDMKYSYFTYVSPNFKNDKYDGTIEFLYGSEVALPKNIIGQSYEDDATGVAICSKNFYPSVERKNVFSLKNIFIDGESLINTTFKIEEDIYRRFDGKLTNTGEKYIKEFKIIGVFDTKETGELLNTCYISPKDANEIFNALLIDLNPDVLTPLVVTVDKYENLSEVATQLRNMGFKVENTMVINTSLINNIKIICNLIIITTITAIVIITFLYVKKNLLNNHDTLGLLKAIGFNKSDICLTYLIQTIILIIFSLLVGISIFNLLITFLKIMFNNYLVINNYAISLQLSSYLLVFLTIFIIPFVTTIFMINNKMKKDPISMLKGRES